MLQHWAASCASNTGAARKSDDAAARDACRASSFDIRDVSRAVVGALPVREATRCAATIHDAHPPSSFLRSAPERRHRDCRPLSRGGAGNEQSYLVAGRPGTGRKLQLEPPGETIPGLMIDKATPPRQSDTWDSLPSRRSPPGRLPCGIRIARRLDVQGKSKMPPMVKTFAARRDHLEVAVIAVADGAPEAGPLPDRLTRPGDALPGAVPALRGGSSPYLFPGCTGWYRAPGTAPGEPKGTAS